MIFRKGEIVFIKSLNCYGRVAFVKDIDKDKYPFYVAYYLKDRININPFTYEEIKIADQFSDQRRIQEFKMLENKYKNYI